LRAKKLVCIKFYQIKTGFWIGYEDGLYEYHYDGTVNILKDAEGKPVIAKSFNNSRMEAW
jgi:hypothetical protein